MINPSERLLDECDVNIINNEGDLTLGDLLCQNMWDSNWLDKTESKQFELKDIELGFMYSHCDSKWKEITDTVQPLRAKEKLCCRPENGKYRFFRCDGSPYLRSDTCKERL